MKKFFFRVKYYSILCVGCLVCFWIASVVLASVLTALFGSEFKNCEQLGCNYSHPWVDEPEIRVLSYLPNKATVYYFSDTGGEKMLFLKENGQWKFNDTLEIWSDTGNADDYFIWPYFKNYVP